MLVHTVEGNPLFLVLGGIAVGAVSAFLLPVSDAERRKVAPIKERAREEIRTATEQIEERAFGGGERASEPYQAPTVH
jgi:hypothetical protein